MFNIGEFENKKKFDINVLTRHAVVLGATGSGKTVLCKSIVEEAVINHIPILAIDPKGDISSLGIASKHFEFRPFSDVEAKINSAEPEIFQKVLKEKYENNLKESDVKPEEIEKYAHAVDINVFTPKSSAGTAISIAPNLKAPKDFYTLYDEDPDISSKLIEPIAESLVLLVDYPSSAKKEITLITKIIEDAWLNSKQVNITDLIREVSAPPFEKIGALKTDAFISKKQREMLASKLNLLITTPSLKYWFNGEDIDFDKILSHKEHSGKTRVNVIDLRFISDDKEKEFFIARILEELYNWMIKQQGTQNLRYILYIDEIKSFIPPFPNNPPSKKILDLIVRQGRAFGLGCLFATQNPGDIDYKMLGNMNTRFIGKLRTEQDIEKISNGINVSSKDITKKINLLKEREFLYNEQDSNEFIRLKPRWVISYHRGPLSEEEIKVLLELKGTRHYRISKIDESETEISTHHVGEKRHERTKETIIEEEEEKINSDDTALIIPLKSTPQHIISSIKRKDNITIELIRSSTRYTPILRCKASISDEKTGIKTEIALNCDLSKNIFIANEEKIDDEAIESVEIGREEKRNQFLDRELAENHIYARLRKLIETRFFVSKEVSFYSKNKNEVIDRNKRFLEQKYKEDINRINDNYNPDVLKKQDKTRELAKSITKLEFESEIKKNKHHDKNGKNGKNDVTEKEIESINKLKKELKKLKQEIDKSIEDRNEEIKEKTETFNRKVNNVHEVNFTASSPQLKMESKKIWLPEQEIVARIKTKTREHEIKIIQNYKGNIVFGKCSKCKKDITDTNDLHICSDCAETLCSKHINIDEISGKEFCDRHYERCSACSKKFGSDTLKECPSCKKRFCPNDLIQCPNCGNIVCHRCIRTEGIFNRTPKNCKICR